MCYKNDIILFNFDMNSLETSSHKYLTISNTDEEWGIVVTTIGHQLIEPQSRYPLTKHPETYDFKPLSGRILNEYQLVYITKGSGYFSSQSCKKQPVKAGTMILLFPGEWHSYYPDPETGWDEYWVGFRGTHIDRRVEKHFFSIEEPLHQIGVSSTIVGLYEDIMKYSEEEKAGYQQIISSIVLHILGAVYYKDRNNTLSNTMEVNIINRARILMKDKIGSSSSPEEIAEELGVGYSRFRRMFKDYTGVSPAQYQAQLRISKAKEMLTGSQRNISEIAYELCFENAGQFSTFFRKKVGITPSEFRRRTH